MEEDFSHFDLGKDLRERDALWDAVREKAIDRFGMLDGSLINFQITAVVTSIDDMQTSTNFIKYVNQMLDQRMSSDAISQQLLHVDFSKFPEVAALPRDEIKWGQYAKAIFIIVLILGGLIALNGGIK